MQVYLMRTFLYSKDSFAKECRIRIIAIEEDLNTVAQCMLIDHPSLPFLQVSFFDALEGVPHAIEFLLKVVVTECKKRQLDKYVIGLNGHVSYGVGLLSNEVASPISFDSLYTLPYYVDYFNQQNFIEHTLTTYTFRLCDINFNNRIIEKIEKTYTYRTMNMKHFKKEMDIFNTLCNRCFCDTPFYFDRSGKSMFELVNEMKFFLRDNNLVFILKGGKEIGFMFWHPDFNEVFPKGAKTNMFSLALRFLLHKKKIESFKLNAIGLIPEHQKSIALTGLLYKTYTYVPKTFKYFETNFVWDANIKSQKINKHMGGTPYRRYSVFEGVVQ